jgi:hypothetical protein
MAVQLKAADTHVVLTALHIYREQEMEAPEPNEWMIQRLDALIKSYDRSFKALARLETI